MFVIVLQDYYEMHSRFRVLQSCIGHLLWKLNDVQTDFRVSSDLCRWIRKWVGSDWIYDEPDSEWLRLADQTIQCMRQTSHGSLTISIAWDRNAQSRSTWFNNDPTVIQHDIQQDGKRRRKQTPKAAEAQATAAKKSKSSGSGKGNSNYATIACLL